MYQIQNALKMIDKNLVHNINNSLKMFVVLYDLIHRLGIFHINLFKSGYHFNNFVRRTDNLNFYISSSNFIELDIIPVFNNLNIRVVTNTTTAKYYNYISVVINGW